MKLKVSHKILTLAVGAAFLSGAVVASVSTYEAGNALDDAAKSKLEAVTAARQSNIKGYLASIEEDVGILSTNDVALSALNAFSAAWAELGGGSKRCAATALYSR